MRLEFIPGYFIDFYQLSRILDVCLKHNIMNRIPTTLFLDTLGISPKRFSILARALYGFGLINERIFTLTEFGYALSKNDIYFENINSLWICNYNISSDRENYVWYRFNEEILPNLDGIKQQDMTEYFSDVNSLFEGKSANKKVSKELSSILDMYTQKEFKRLKLLIKDDEDHYYYDGSLQISDLAFLYCLLTYKERKEISESALTIDEIINKEDTPSQVFHLEEYEVMDKLNTLNSKQLISIERFGDLNQVRFPASLIKEKVLNEIYGGQS